MLEATEVRAGNVLKIDGAACKVLSHEIRGTGKFGKTVHLKLKRLGDGHFVEKSLRAEERIEDVETRYVKLQYLYKDQDQFIFMNNESYEQFPISAKAIGRQEIFLRENTEVSALFIGDEPVTIEFPKIAELKVVSAPPGVKGQADTTFKEVDLENGLKVRVPQFIREGEVVRITTDDLTYLDRVTTKSLKSGAEIPPEKTAEKKPSPKAEKSKEEKEQGSEK